MARISLDRNTITIRSDDYRNAPKLGHKGKGRHSRQAPRLPGKERRLR